MQLSFFDSLKEEVADTPGGIVPRDYQESAISRAFELWRGGSVGVIVRQPTGTGKTVVGTLTAHQWLSQGPDYRVMVLAHEKQLIWQFADEITDILGERPGVEMASLAVEPYAIPPITVASRATLWVKSQKDELDRDIEISRLHKFDPHSYKWLLILDEVHRWQTTMKSCKHILGWFRQNPACKTLGLTATPERGDHKTLAKVTPDVAADYRLYNVDGGKCAVADGWAVPYDQRFVTVEGVDFKSIRENRGDFDEAQLETELSTTKALASMVEPTLDLVGRRRTIMFCVTVKHAKEVASYINALAQKHRDEGRAECDIHGEAVELDGSAPPDLRRDVYQRHQSGAFQFLVVVGLCREGYNDPGIQAVAVFRPTKSRGLAEQMKGRGCRPLRGCVTSTMTREQRLAAIASSDKSSCMIVDLVGVSGMGDCASTAHIMASGKPDEVIERANRNASQKAKDDPNASLDMAEEVRRAQAEIDAEREEARKARLERERLEREAAERRAALGAEVTYSAHNIGQGHGARNIGLYRYDSDVLQYGKHKGQKVSQVSTAYLRRIVEWDAARWQWKKQAQRELDRRSPPSHVHKLDDINSVLLNVPDVPF